MLTSTSFKCFFSLKPTFIRFIGLKVIMNFWNGLSIVTFGSPWCVIALLWKEFHGSYMYLISMDISLHLAIRKFTIHFNTKLNDVYDITSFCIITFTTLCGNKNHYNLGLLYHWLNFHVNYKLHVVVALNLVLFPFHSQNKMVIWRMQH
jgi:hypothetical protein